MTTLNNEDAELHPVAISLYKDREFWKEETSIKKVEEWSVAELRSWIEAYIQRADQRHRDNRELPRPKPELVAVVQKILRVMEEETIAGDLLIAGGKECLAEKAAIAMGGKADRMRLPHAVSLVFAAVEEATDLRGSMPYWERLWRNSAAGNALCEEFEAAEGIGTRFRLALEPHPLETIRYASLTHVETADVTEADLYVEKSIVADPHCFKVVSVAIRDDPAVIWCNLIYVRNDLGSETRTAADGAATTAVRSKREERRRKKRGAFPPRWELLVSVDFARHGSAPPGHWHLNRNSCGDLLPHFGLGHEGGGDKVWHGREDGCPLWWHFIPYGMFHKDIPQRLANFYSTFASRKV